MPKREEDWDWELISLSDIPKTGIFWSTPVYNNNYIRGEDATTVEWRYGHFLYRAQEDPDDGYRSCMGEIKRVRWSLVSGLKRFTQMKRSETIKEHVYVEDHHFDGDIRRFFSRKTNKQVFSVGTDYSDDYYPWFVAEWKPDGLEMNSEELLHQREQNAIADMRDEALF